MFQGEKLVPSVTRVFSTARDLYVYLQAYERGATETQPLVAFVTFYKGDVKAFETQPIQVTDGLDARSKAVPLRFSIPLQGIAPGPLRLPGDRARAGRPEGRLLAGAGRPDSVIAL